MCVPTSCSAWSLQEEHSPPPTPVFQLQGDLACMITSLGKHLNKTWAALPNKHLRDYLVGDGSLGVGDAESRLSFKNLSWF